MDTNTETQDAVESLAGAVVPLHPSSFGHFFCPEWPENTNAAVLCVVGTGGLEPLHLILQHQCYLKDIAKIKKDHPELEEVVLIPINSDDYKTVWRSRGLKKS